VTGAGVTRPLKCRHWTIGIATRLIDELQDVTTSQQRAVSKKKLVQECRRYVGFMNYFARFIPRYSALASCVQDQTKDIAPEWTPSVPVHGTLCVPVSGETTLMYHLLHPCLPCLFRCFYPGWGMLVQYDGNDEHVVAFCARKLQVLRSTTLPLNRSYWASYSALCSGICYLEGPRRLSCILTMNP
jgi:hypothetical protein